MTSKKAILTIDDAPSPTMREKVDFLNRRGIRAVWFCNGIQLEARPEPALYAIRQGQILGNHAYEHPHFSELTLTEGLDQIRRTDILLEELYQLAGEASPGKFFRFPYGDKGGERGSERRRAFQEYLADLGYTSPPADEITYQWYQEAGLREDRDWFWTYDTKDWALNRLEPVEGLETLEKLFARMDEDHPEDGLGLNRVDSAEIVLMHDHERTLESFYAIVERLRAKGLAFDYTGGQG